MSELLHHVQSFTQTTDACPSQWEGVLSDGTTFYVRYRFGRLSCHIPTPETYHDYQHPVFVKAIGGAMDGVMDSDDMKHHLTGVLDFTTAHYIPIYSEWI